MTRTHVLLDLDGTISDSWVGIGRSLRHAFTTCGYQAPTDAVIRSLIGPPFEISLPTIGIPVDDLERVIGAYRDRYEEVGLYENELYDGVPAMLETLADRYVVALATSKPEPTAKRIIEHFGLAQHFTVQAGAAVGVGSGRRTKGDVIAYALGELGIDSGPHVVMIGDRAHDVEGAHLNEIDCIGVAWGFGDHAELRGAGALTIVDSPADVAETVAVTYRSAQP